MAAVEPPRRGWLPAIVIGLLAAGLACTIITVASGAFGVLTALLFPPLPPLPGALTPVSHTSDVYGRDVWEYTAAAPPCAVLVQVAAFDGAACTVEPGVCPGYDAPVPDTFYDDAIGLVATCTGAEAFSIFGQTWTTSLFRSTTADVTRVRVLRQVRWGG
jgi:hypothetical protein